MTASKKSKRKKQNETDLERRFHNDIERKFSFLLERPGTVEFIAPQKSHSNQFLFYGSLQKINSEGKASKSGKLGDPKYFYIEEATFKKINELFTRFKIPAVLHHDLIRGFLSMVFASCEAPFITNFHHELDVKKKELVLTIDLLNAFQKNKKLLRGVRFEYVDMESHQPSEKEHLNINGHIAAKFLQKVLVNYQQIQEFDSYKWSYDRENEKDKIDPFFGHKNAEKHSQNYFTSTLFDYLRQNLFHSAFNFTDEDSYEKEIKRLKRIYSRRQLFLFIGELMILSGLLGMKHDSDQEDIIDHIKKKLKVKLQADRQHIQSIVRSNAKSTNNTVEALPFYKLF